MRPTLDRWIHPQAPASSRVTRGLAIGALVLTLLVVPGCTGQSGTPPAEASRAAQETLDDWLAGSDLVGVSAAIASPEGTWAGAAGSDGSGEPLVPQAAMGIGSITKTFTAAEVLLLAERGFVDLDAPIDDYLDLTFDTQGATVRQLLGMRSGFPDPTDAVFLAASQDQQHVWTTQDWYALADPDEPGVGRQVDRFTYNNLNYIALSDLIEAVTGQSYADALHDDLLDPAGLERIWVQDDDKPEPPVAVGVDDPDLPLVDAAGPWLPSRAISSAGAGAGSIAADAPTVAAWGLALYAGSLLDPASVQAMTTTSDIYGYGLGTGVAEDADGNLVVGHDGDVVVYTSMLTVWPDQQIAVAVLSPQGADRPLDSLVDTLHQAWTQP